MRYIQLKIHASRQGIEAVLPLLISYGIEGISVDDPADFESIMDKKNPYDWDYVDASLMDHPDREPTLTAWLEDTEENRRVVQDIKVDILKLKAEEQYQTFGADADFGRLYVETETVDDDAWKDKWKENFKPARVTDRIVVKPTWEHYDAKTDELVLEIDPGSAFGTGTHETTALCMKLLEKYIGQLTGGAMGDNAEGISCCVQMGADVPNPKVLDVGCGSGILSIAAALLGCRDVLGIEIDPEAVEVAKENIELNGFSDTVEVRQGDLTKGVNYKADIIVANLMHHLVMSLAPSAKKHLSKEGIFISSGILLEKRDQVAQAIRDAGFDILEIQEDGDWCAIVARPKKKLFGLF